MAKARKDRGKGWDDSHEQVLGIQRACLTPSPKTWLFQAVLRPVTLPGDSLFGLRLAAEQESTAFP